MVKNAWKIPCVYTSDLVKKADYYTKVVEIQKKMLAKYFVKDESQFFSINQFLGILKHLQIIIRLLPGNLRLF